MKKSPACTIRRPAALGRALMVLALLVLSAPAAQAEEKASPLVAYLEASVTTSGASGWDRFEVGGSTLFKVTNVITRPDGKATRMSSESRTVLADREGTTSWIETATRRDANTPWKAHTRKREQKAKTPKARRVDQGAEDVEIGKASHRCHKTSWVVKSGEKDIPVLTVYTHPEHGVLKWVTVDGNWTSTYAAQRLDVTRKVGEKTVSCREFRRIAKASNMPTTFESTELWSAAVPGWVVRAETVQTSKMGDKVQRTTQVRELQAFQATPRK